MRHRVKGRKLNRTSSHRKALMRNLATQLFEHKRIITTEAKAKELRPYAERILTRAKKAYAREQQGLLPEGQSFDVHSRRIIGRDLMSKQVIEMLFDEIVPEIGERAGGYTRIVKLGNRLGDGGSKALIELVDYNTEQDPSFKKTKKKKSTTAPKKEAPAVEEKVEEEVVSEETVEEVVAAEAIEEVVSTEEKTEESSAEDTQVAEETIEVEETAVEDTTEVEETETTEEPSAEAVNNKEVSEDDSEEKKED